MRGFRQVFSSLRHRDFALFWTAALISNSGSWMQTVTVPFVLYQLTHHSRTWLGIGAFAQLFPAFAIGPWSGTLADRFSRKRILLITQSVQMLVAFSLWSFWVAGRATPAIIITHLTVSGIVSGINITSWQSFVPLLVPRESLPGAVRLNSMQFTAARAFGPALGGVVLAAFGPATAFMTNAVTFLLVIGALVIVRPREAEVVGAGERFVEHFRQGLAYVRARQSLVLAVVTMTAVSFFASSVVQLAPALAKDQFGVAAGGYGALVAMFGTGAIVGVLIASLYGDVALRSRMALSGLVIMVAGVLLLSAAPTYWLGMAALFVMGVAYLLVAVALNTSIQVRVAEAYRGRVLSIYLMGLLGGVPLGALLEGRLGDVVGLRPTVAGAGVALGLFSLYAVAHFRALRPLDEALEDVDEAPGFVGRGVRVADSPAA